MHGGEPGSSHNACEAVRVVQARRHAGAQAQAQAQRQRKREAAVSGGVRRARGRRGRPASTCAATTTRRPGSCGCPRARATCSRRPRLRCTRGSGSKGGRSALRLRPARTWACPRRPARLGRSSPAVRARHGGWPLRPRRSRARAASRSAAACHRAERSPPGAPPCAGATTSSSLVSTERRAMPYARAACARTSPTRRGLSN